MTPQNFIYLFLADGAELYLMYYYFIRFSGRKPSLFHSFCFTVPAIVLVYLLPWPLILKLALLGLLMILCGILFFHLPPAVCLLRAAVIVAILQLCHGITNSLITLLFPHWYRFPPLFFHPFILLFGIGAALVFACLCCHFAVKYISFAEPEQNRQLLIFLTPLLFLLLIFFLINDSVYASTVVIYQEEPELLIAPELLLLIQFFGILGFFGILSSYQKVSQNFRLNVQVAALEEEAQYQKQYVEEAQVRYERTSSFRHDFINHITVVERLLSLGNYDQARDYLHTLGTIPSALSFPCHTNRPVLDILISNKFGAAEASGIETACSLCLPDSCLIPDFDFCILLSNALDNAIHACLLLRSEEKPYLMVSGRNQGNLLYLEIENSFFGTAPREKGTGLLNMAAIVEKYHGSLSITCEGGRFRLGIVLNLPQHPENISQQIYGNPVRSL